MRIVNWPRTIALAILAMLAMAILLFNLPLVECIGQIRESRLIRPLAEHRRLVAVVAAMLAVGTGVWLLRQRRIWLAPVLLLVATACIGAAAYRFQSHYPNARLLDAARYGDGLQILLGRDVLLSRFEPVPALKVQRTPVERAAFPVIDVHFHLESMTEAITPEMLVKAMDEAGVAQIVNLGGLPGTFEKFAKTFHARYPDRFIMFVKPDPDALAHGNHVAEQVEWVKRAVRMGARGIKENKSFGLGQRDDKGKLVPVDDPRWDPLWALAGQLGMPVLVHTGEPTAFFAPIDNHNERYEELLQNPAWSVTSIADAPSQRQLMEQRERLLARHPHTVFIAAHLGMNPDDLAYAASLLDRFPNYYVDMSSVVSELGRTPAATRAFFIKYQDRILFGTDGGFGLQPDTHWTAQRMYRSYFQFLETADEYIEYPLMDITKQGTWRVYGLALPRDVLEKIYSRNAMRLIPSSTEIVARLDGLGTTH